MDTLGPRRQRAHHRKHSRRSTSAKSTRGCTRLAGTLEVGERVQIVQLRPALRCVMATHGQAELGRDLRILRTAAQHHRNQVGVWASIGAGGHVRVGDPVVLVT